MKAQHLANGGTVWVEGYEFVVTNLRIVEANFSRVSYGLNIPEMQGPGVPVAEFTGVLTSNPCNNPIRGTMYDGATYGGNSRVYTW